MHERQRQITGVTQLSQIGKYCVLNVEGFRVAMLTECPVHTVRVSEVLAEGTIIWGGGGRYVCDI